jgi:predicted PurR-regulated permease PerM
MTDRIDLTPPPPPPEPAGPARQRERRALGFLALAALACLVRLAVPVGIGLFLGALLAFTLEPLYKRLRQRQIGAGPSALMCALGTTLVSTGMLFALSTLFVSSGLRLAASVRDMLASGTLRAFLEHLGGRLAAFHINVDDLSAKVESEVLSAGARVANVAAAVAGVTFGALLTLFFITMSAYFVLRHWKEIVENAELLLPFERRHTHALFEQFRRVGREVLLGTVVTGLVQGAFAAVGFWVTGVPEPMFFGALTALASLVPGVGTVLVWSCAGVGLILTGHVGAGLVELTYGALVVGIVCDYVVRPRLVGREARVPPILMFVALFGGVEVFGIIGLILGPVLATLSYAVLKTYAQEAGAGSAT